MPRLLASVPAALLAVLALAGPARADFGACPTQQAPRTTCETLTVPLDRSGGVPGQVHLFVERRAAAQASKGALLVLAGGPGQAATPLIDQVADALGPALVNRDLIVFDARGTGASDPLSCPGLDAATTTAQNDLETERCANMIGPARAFYTSRDNADDIDAVRQSLGLDKVALYGVSYGTYTALTYARRHPAHVQSLVLDSVLGPNGVDAFERNSYVAYPRVLRDICRTGCGRITRDPVADLTRLTALARRKPLRATLYGPSGRRHVLRIGEGALRILLTGADPDPTARAEIPSSLVSARRGDNAPLIRLLAREATNGSKFAPSASPNAVNNALFVATECEETAFPWARDAPLSARPAQRDAALAAIPASAFAPFSRRVEATTGPTRACLRWPDGSVTSPQITGTPADVPVLLLSGVDDTRTPLESARSTGALFPQSQLAAIPQTGHSVLGTDLTGCARLALTTFVGGSPVAPCSGGPALFPPSPIAPVSINQLRPARKVAGKRGRTITAVAATLNDSVRQSIGLALLGGTIAEGGLRGGTLRGSLTATALVMRFNKLVYVPGVELTGTATLRLGTFTSASARLRVGGRAASHGAVNFGSGGFSGKLDGRTFHTASAAAAPQRLPTAAALLAARAWARLTR